MKYLKANTVNEKYGKPNGSVKAINVTLKYGMSDGFPFQTNTTVIHPSTKVNILQGGGIDFYKLIGQSLRRRLRKAEVRSLDKGREKVLIEAGRRPKAPQGLFSFLAS